MKPNLTGSVKMILLALKLFKIKEMTSSDEAEMIKVLYCVFRDFVVNVKIFFAVFSLIDINCNFYSYAIYLHTDDGKSMKY
jgi:hypothetical protein